MKKTITAIALVVATFFISISVTLAWFAGVVNINPDVPASAVTGYFESGSGTKDDPYIISSKNHLYNLAWLQYMGRLNEYTTDEEGNPRLTQYYFKLKNDIDMTGVILPPIGTAEHPFIGHFDGNGKCISNLTVSNYLSEGEEDKGINKRPLSITTINGTTASIVGFFGIIGAVNDEMKALLATENATDARQMVNSVHDLFLDNLTVRTESSESLIGLLAGYVNGSVGNVGIGTSSIELGANVMPLTQSEVVEMGQIISAYSLIGQYDEGSVYWHDVPTREWIDDGGGGEGWGGSMDIYELIRRVSYMFTENMKQSNKNSYPVTFYNYGNIYYTYTNATSQQIGYLAKTSILPINADTETMFSGSDTLISTYYPTNSYYSSHSSEIVASNNTGYIVGGGTSASSAWVRVRIGPLANGTYGGIYKSIGTSKTANPSFSRNNFEMLTIDANGTTYVIKDSQNGNANTAVNGNEINYATLGLQKYEEVVSSFSQTMAGKTMTYGLRFYPSASAGISIENNKVTSATTTADVSLFGETYSNYQMIDGAINFKVQGPGIITTIAGTYANQSGNHSFFNLIEINRGSNNQITSARVIEKIWVKYSGDTIVDIQYNDDISNTTGYTLKYSSSMMNTLATSQAAYYFELPVKKGDYALGAIKGSSAGAYLLYLDIGSNGNMSSGEGTETQKTHGISGVTFVDMEDLETLNDMKTTNGYNVIIHEISLNNDATSHTGLDMSYERTSRSAMNVTEDDPSGVFTIRTATSDTTINSNSLNQAAILSYRRREDTA